MWTDKIAEHAAKMRARVGPERIAELLREPFASKAGKKYIDARISADERRVGLDKSRAKALAKGDTHRKSIIALDAGTQLGQRFIDSKKRKDYPGCPHCKLPPSNSKRAGVTPGGIQRYRCGTCNRTYSGPTVRVKLEPQDYKMLCHHCGSTNTKRLGRAWNESRTGRAGHCLACKRKFVQGGLHDLQRYHLLLEKRIIDLHLPGDVEAEVLQQASVDVLSGKGYCWTVELKTKEAWRNTRGEYNQRGSDHPVFKSQQGQKYSKD